tara:strand:- start:706 stop:2490 length:1785 start_codon:yes stop_codon:yes gene_type:complete
VVEQRPEKPCVGGSIPPLGTIYNYMDIVFFILTKIDMENKISQFKDFFKSRTPIEFECLGSNLGVTELLKGYYIHLIQGVLNLNNPCRFKQERAFESDDVVIERMYNINQICLKHNFEINLNQLQKLTVYKSSHELDVVLEEFNGKVSNKIIKDGLFNSCNTIDFINEYIQSLALIEAHPKFKEFNQKLKRSYVLKYGLNCIQKLQEYSDDLKIIELDPRYNLLTNKTKRKIHRNYFHNYREELERNIVVLDSLESLLESREFLRISRKVIRNIYEERGDQTQGYLVRILNKAEEILSTPKFLGLPESIIHIVIYSNFENPELALEKNLRTIQEIQVNPRYKSFSLDSIYRAFYVNFDDPKSVLDENLLFNTQIRINVIHLIELAKANPEFKKLGLRVFAVISSSRTISKKIMINPKTYFFEKLRVIKDLLKKEEFHSLSKTAITKLVFKVDDNYYKFAKEFQEIYLEIKSNPIFSEVTDRAIYYAILSDPSSAIKYLERKTMLISKYQKSSEYSILESWYIRKTILDNKHFTKILDNTRDQFEDFIQEPMFSYFKQSTLFNLFIYSKERGKLKRELKDKAIKISSKHKKRTKR